jgi:hypothetical protein
MSEPPDTSLPTTKDDPAAMLALIGAEMELCLRHGESPDVEDYCRRFPELAERIRQRWALVLAGDGDDESLATAAPSCRAPSRSWRQLPESAWSSPSRCGN